MGRDSLDDQTWSVTTIMMTNGCNAYGMKLSHWFFM